MNLQTKASLMVARGEARNYYHACSLLGRRSHSNRRPKAKDLPVRVRLPYRDD